MTQRAMFLFRSLFAFRTPESVRIFRVEPLIDLNWPSYATRDNAALNLTDQLQPLVPPQVSHFRQVPLRTMVKLPHSEQLSPS